MDKIPLVVGNWKMELSHKSAVEVSSAIKKMVVGNTYNADIVICPSFPSLAAVYDAMKGTQVAVCAQDVHHEEKGAYTGGVSVGQLREFISWCIVGHSEVRAAHGDTDLLIAHKTKLLLSHGIRPVVCIGETQEQHDAGDTISVISMQIDVLLSSLDRVSLLKTVIAYEPIWAIGTGTLPHPDEVYEVLLLIRKRIAERFDIELADRVHLLYGGSVQADNVHSYIAGPGADGVLVGGASIHPRDFVDIISNVATKYAL
jgi:triosephosphate isomerase (TIM)